MKLKDYVFSKKVKKYSLIGNLGLLLGILLNLLNKILL